MSKDQSLAYTLQYLQLHSTACPACIDEQERGVIVWDHWGGGHKIVHLTLEELHKGVSDFLQLADASS